MKRVRIIVPFDGFSVGDTPEFFGHVARRHVAEGRAEEITEADGGADDARPKRRTKSKE